MTQTAMNASTFADMRAEMGEAFNEVVTTYLEYIPELITQLGSAIDSADAEGTFNFAHSIKSSSGSIGAQNLAKIAEDIEKLGRSGTTEGTTSLYAELKISLAEVVSFLKQELGNS